MRLIRNIRAPTLLCALILVVLSGSVGCVSFAVGPPPDPECYRESTAEERERWSPKVRRGKQIERAHRGCGRNSLTIGFFPTIGEAHQNGLATNGRKLTPGLRMADYTLRPLSIAAINFLAIGIPTAMALALEYYEDYSTSRGACSSALIGYCKGRKLIPKPEPRPISDEDELRADSGFSTEDQDSAAR